MENVLGQDVFDVIILLTLTVFTIRGWLNGFVGEVAAVASIVGGLWTAHTFHDVLNPYLTFIPSAFWRSMASYVLLFIAAVIAVGLIARLLQRILTFAFASLAEKICGAVLGFVKGMLLCSLVFLVIGRFFPDASFYKKSHTRPYFSSLIETIRASLPPDVVKRIQL